MKPCDPILRLGASCTNAAANPFQLLPIQRTIFSFLCFCVNFPLCFLFQIRTVISLIFENLSSVYFNNFSGNAVQKVPVVGYHNNGTPIFQQLFFQQSNRFVVNMVGRFVQQQNIAGLNQSSSNAGTPLFAARQCTNISGFVCNAQFSQNRLRFKRLCLFKICRQMQHDLFQYAAVRFKLRNLRQV